MNIQPRIVYSPDYDVRFLGLEKLHPFDSCKYSRAWNHLIEKFGSEIDRFRIIPKLPATDDDLKLIHTPDYLQSLKQSPQVAKALELGEIGLLPAWVLDRQVLQPMRLATQGTILAAQAAIEHGIAINLSGGYHHASRDHGEGFCVYADVAIAIETLRRSNTLEAEDQVIVIDLDAHQGNGVERTFHDDPKVHILDMYNQNIYPQDWWAKERIDCDIPINRGISDRDYLDLLKQKLPAFLQTVDRPKIAFYNAGTDIYASDPLGGLNISEQGVLERDRFVFHTLTEAGIPWVMVLSGGYTKQSYLLVANSVAYVLETWGYLD